ncbi:uncharacterized protein [Physcomitrium patens]|uniref:Protein ABIL1 n=1 Tax=Physcomitrium patens TaxID=3218 RepID=A0A2K1K3M5_PHYPA|nr:protein ABIL3-like [Physcomitrium patens]XP_024384023.1 protein ABIL3-like [Physcomitrium patens]PNR48378.1 hypothetical protein PHYPA_012854 [Physcomitrium patens]|eukprot:XP_024384022.1 protein ABIL3-like [Physcomitrella patens]
MEKERPPREAMRTESPTVSREEQELDKTRTFFLALEELQSLRPQLYQAADYCEHQYLFGDNKQGVLDNLKDYSVKALVNAVDHLGTVAYKLNDLISMQHEAVDNTQLAASAIAQRLRACQEHSDREGLKQQSMAKTMHVNHKQYTLPDEIEPLRAGQRTLMRETFDLGQPTPLTRMHTAVETEAQAQLPLPHTPRSELSDPGDLNEMSGPETWFFAPDFAAAANSNEVEYSRSGSIGKQATTSPSLLNSRASFLNRSTTNNTSFKRATTIQPSRVPSVSPTNRYAGAPMAGGIQSRSATPRAGSMAPIRTSTARSGSMTPLRTPPPMGTGPTKSHGLEKTMFLTPTAPPAEVKNSKGKGILRSLLGRKN